ncbi:FMN-binding negative transcriptional regulator [Mycolicibacterium sp. XJ870]
MYLPPKFALTAEETDAALAQAGFAHLVTYAASGLVVTPLPLLYDGERHSLIGHVARANPHWHAAGAESVAIFAGPHAYVSPGFYETKPETGKVVPTWNYEVLNAYGRLEVHDDAEWVLGLVTRLTDRHEASQAQPWRVTDAPASFTRAQLNGIVGVELPIERVEAKAKMSQNQPARNRAGVIAGLAASDSAADLAVSERVAAFDPDRRPAG